MNLIEYSELIMYRTSLETLNVYQEPKNLDNHLLSQNEELKIGYQMSLEVMKEHSKSFFFASKNLSPDQRNSVASLYAFSRLVDDIVDESIGLENEDITKILDYIKEQITKLALKGYTSDNIYLKTFGYTIRKHSIPIQYIHDLIEGVRMDLTKKEYYTNQELDLYCYRVASTIGLMMVHIMMDKRSGDVIARAKVFGLVMQLPNIVREVKEDYNKGRIYLPYETREQYGITESDLKGSKISPNFKKMLEYEIERAKGLYQVAELGIDDLPKEAQFTILVASRVYGEILNQIRRNKYNILSKRAVVSKPRKVFILVKMKFKNLKQNFMNFITLRKRIFSFSFIGFTIS